MDLFGPLPKQYCLYFYFLSILGFFLMAIVLIVTLYSLFSKKMGGNAGQLIMIFLGYFILYFQNRLLYTMCIDSTGAAGSKISGGL
jgi:hypothetical protein